MTDSLGRLKINTSKVECRHKGCSIGNGSGRDVRDGQNDRKMKGKRRK
jgi:hypothetical protein